MCFELSSIKGGSRYIGVGPHELARFLEGHIAEEAIVKRRKVAAEVKVRSIDGDGERMAKRTEIANRGTINDVTFHASVRRITGGFYDTALNEASDA